MSCDRWSLQMPWGDMSLCLKSKHEGKWIQRDGKRFWGTVLTKGLTCRGSRSVQSLLASVSYWACSLRHHKAARNECDLWCSTPVCDFSSLTSSVLRKLLAAIWGRALQFLLLSDVLGFLSQATEIANITMLRYYWWVCSFFYSYTQCICWAPIYYVPLF